MKFWYSGIILILFIFMLTGCGKSEKADTIKSPTNPQQPQILSQPTKIIHTINNIEKYHNRRIRIIGDYIHGDTPTVKIKNLAVANEKGIVELKLSDQLKKTISSKNIGDGDQIIAVGVVQTEGLDIPVVEIEKIQKFHSRNK